MNEEFEEETYSMGDVPLDPTELMKEDTFLGDTPFDTILEGIRDQFNDYIRTEDITDYVEIFYRQLDISREALQEEDEMHPQERKEILDQLESQFTSEICTLINDTIGLSIVPYENDDESDDNQIPFVISTIYDFFILNAKKVLQDVITTHMVKCMPSGLVNDESFFEEAGKQILQYSPRILCMTTDEFLSYTSSGSEIVDLYENGMISGNFLRKFSPRFYQNEEFEVAVLNNVTLKYQLSKEVRDGGENENVNPNP